MDIVIYFMIQWGWKKEVRGPDSVVVQRAEQWRGFLARKAVDTPLGQTAAAAYTEQKLESEPAMFGTRLGLGWQWERPGGLRSKL